MRKTLALAAIVFLLGGSGGRADECVITRPYSTVLELGSACITGFPALGVALNPCTSPRWPT